MANMDKNPGLHSWTFWILSFVLDYLFSVVIPIDCHDKM